MQPVLQCRLQFHGHICNNCNPHPMYARVRSLPPSLLELVLAQVHHHSHHSSSLHSCNHYTINPNDTTAPLAITFTWDSTFETAIDGHEKGCSAGTVDRNQEFLESHLDALDDDDSHRLIGFWVCEGKDTQEIEKLSKRILKHREINGTKGQNVTNREASGKKTSNSLSSYKKSEEQSIRQAQAAVLLLQAFVRRFIAQNHDYTHRRSVLTLQALFRGKHARNNVQAQRRAAAILQSRWRGVLARYSYRRSQESATDIQARVLGMAARTRYGTILSSSIRLQAFVRGRSACKEWLGQKDAALLIQQHWRQYVLKQGRRRTQAAVRLLQAFVRRVIAQNRYYTGRRNVLTLQAFFRGKQARSDIQAQQRAAVILQNHWRGVLARYSYRRSQESATVIQARVLGIAARTRYGVTDSSQSGIPVKSAASTLIIRSDDAFSTKAALFSSSKANNLLSPTRRQHGAGAGQQVDLFNDHF
jgi:Tfp pilus assembly protein PilE